MNCSGLHFIELEEAKLLVSRGKIRVEGSTLDWIGLDFILDMDLGLSELRRTTCHLGFEK